MNIIVSTPEPMSRLRVLTPSDLAADTLTALQRLGVLHPEQSSDLAPLDRAALDREWSATGSLLHVIEDVIAFLPQDKIIQVGPELEAILVRPVSEIAADTRRVCAALTSLHHRLTELEEHAGRWRELGHITAVLAAKEGLGTRDLDFTGNWVCSRLAVFARDEHERVAVQLETLSYTTETVQSDDEIAVFVVTPTARLPELEALVEGHGRFVTAPGDDAPLAGLAATVDAEVERLEREQGELRAKIEARTLAELESLVMLREALRADRERLGLLRMATASKYVTVFEGWVPSRALEATVDALREACRCVHVESAPANANEHPPSQLDNPAVLKPFEVLIGLFSMPRYGQWDPTPIVAWFFALFFGLMLGDVVYGLMLLLLARFGLPRLTVDPDAEGFVRFRQLLTVCAGAAIVFGLLQGAYLGDFLARFLGAPDLALSQTLRGFTLDPMLFIVASLGIGFVHVNLGHLLMLIRGVKERRAYAVIGRVGLFLLQVAAVPWILRILRIEWLPLGELAFTFLAWLGLAATVLIIVASVMERGGFLGSILWLFDITGILGDVMSYARLAGVGLATYFLAYSFNMMAVLLAGMMPDNAVGLVLSAVIVLVILVFGHLLNLLLSSITCFVHALRLCFVEFLFKFYEGGGRAYAPFRLRRRTRVPAKAAGESSG